MDCYPVGFKTECERQNYKMLVGNIEKIKVGKHLCKTQNTTRKENIDHFHIKIKSSSH